MTKLAVVDTHGPRVPDMGAIRRSIACARALLDELEHRLPEKDALARAGLAEQAAEELLFVARLLSVGSRPATADDSRERRLARAANG